jgi:hypothetical protein
MNTPRTQRRFAPWSALRLVVVAWTIIGLWARPGLAQSIESLPSAAAMIFDRAAVPHAWLVVQESSAGEFFLVHVPPRESVGADGKLHGAPAGTLRVATRLKQKPLAMAAMDAAVYMAFAPPTPQEGLEVLALEAMGSGVGDLWRYEPDGRLRTLRSLPPGVKLLALVGLPGGPSALVADADGTNARLLELRGDEWLATPLPLEAAEMINRGGIVHAIPVRGGIALHLDWNSVERWWVVRHERREGPAIFETVPAAANVRWAGASGFVQSDGNLSRWGVAEGVLKLTSGEGEQLLAQLKLAPEAIGLAVVPLDGVGRLLVVQSVSGSTPGAAPSADESKPVRNRLLVSELSSATGRVMYEGEPKSASPIAPDDFRAVVLVLFFGMSLTIGLVLVTSSRSDVVPLGNDWTLASPATRFVAGFIDLFAAAAIAGRILGVPFEEVLTPAGVLYGGGSLALMTLAVGLVLGIIAEAAIGRSLGKLLCGCEVVGWRGSEPPRSARLWQVCVRNLIKWVLPPVALLAFIDPSGRHRGETLSRTAVVVRIEPEEDQ